MPCYNCSVEFGILKKEIGCQVCGFSFCSKCCKKQEIVLDNGDSMKQVVCNGCFMKLTGVEASTISKGSPPLAHKKRMAALKKQSFSVDSSSHVRLHSQLSNEKDKELSERLQRLKRDRIKEDLPSERELEVRIAKLKGMDPSKYNAPPIQVYRPPDKRTAIKQADDLIEQLTEEVHLDSKIVKPEDEIAARLAALRDETPKKPKEEPVIPSFPGEGNNEEMDIENAHSILEGESQDLSMAACKELKELTSNPEYKNLLSSMQQKKETESSDDDDEKEENELVEKLLAKTYIDDEMDDLDSLNDQNTEKSTSSSQEASVEEFPWCVICTDDAKIRCFGCEQDLYCIRCFKECHDSLDIKDHKTCPFLPPRRPSGI